MTNDWNLINFTLKGFKDFVKYRETFNLAKEFNNHIMRSESSLTTQNFYMKNFYTCNTSIA